MSNKENRKKTFLLAENRIALFVEYFFNETSRFGVNLGSSGGSAECEDIRGLLRGHLLGSEASAVTVTVKPKNKKPYVRSGRYRVGLYAPGQDGNTKWALLDFDGGKKKAFPLQDPMGVALSTLSKLREAGIAAYLEKSGSGDGWHIWIFFERPIPCGQARKLGLAFVPTDAPLVKGCKIKCADPEAGKGIEVFPKQSKFNKGDFGNYVWLPWWSNAPKGANRFYREGNCDA